MTRRHAEVQALAMLSAATPEGTRQRARAREKLMRQRKQLAAERQKLEAEREAIQEAAERERLEAEEHAAAEARAASERIAAAAKAAKLKELADMAREREQLARERAELERERAKLQAAADAETKEADELAAVVNAAAHASEYVDSLRRRRSEWSAMQPGELRMVLEERNRLCRIAQKMLQKKQLPMPPWLAERPMPPKWQGQRR